MAEIKNPDAYFTRMVQNSYKNEYRSNDSFFNHISSVGCEADIRRKYSGEKESPEHSADCIEQALSETSVENWLLFMENERLHTALRSLPVANVEFLLELSRFHYNLAAFAAANGISKQAASKRFRRLRNKILEII